MTPAFKQRKSAILAKHDPKQIAEPAPAPRMGDVGLMLRTAREERRLDLREVAERLRIRHSFLSAIEEGRYGDLPGPTYAVGFVRAYAEAMGLDGDEIVRRFKDESAIVPKNADLDFPTPVNEGGLPSGAIILLALILAGAVYGVWYWSTTTDRPIAEMIQDVPDRFLALIKRDGGEQTAATPDAAPVPAVPERPVSEQTAPGQSVSGRGGAEPSGIARPADPAAPATAEAPPPADTADVEPPRAESDLAADVPERSAPSAAPERPAPSAAPERPAPAVAPEPPAQTAAVADEPASRPEPAQAPAASPAAPATAPADEAPRTAPVERAVEPAGETAATPAVPAPAPAPATPPAAPPAPELAAPPANVPTDGRVFGSENSDARIVLRARADSWVQVRSPEGLLLTRLLKRGDSYRVPANRGDLELMVGNAGGLLIEVDGRTLPPMGRTGEVLRGIPLDVERLKAGVANAG